MPKYLTRAYAESFRWPYPQRETFTIEAETIWEARDKGRAAADARWPWTPNNDVTISTMTVLAPASES